MSEGEENRIEVPRQRSPAYPYIPLDAAIERAGKIYAQVREHAQPREVLAKVYGKPATSSSTIQTFATLLQYGLLENVSAAGDRRMRVSPLAREILHPHAPADAVAAATKKAALKPPIFAELWSKFGDTKSISESVPLYYLTSDREREHGSVFTDKAAGEVLRIYRVTLDYAGLTDADRLHAEEPEEEAPLADNPETENRTEKDAVAEQRKSPNPPSGSKERSIQMATGERELQTGILSKGASYRVIVSGKIGVREIERLIAKLELDKEILADSEDNDEAQNAGGDDQGVFG
jgi:hypothetical protein